MLALAEPRPGGDLDELRKLLAIESDSSWYLTLAWLVEALSPNGPYPVQCLYGEQGSGKSLRARILRGLTDPSESSLRSPPASSRDLMISANNSWVQVFDNLSHVTQWFSDGLCSLSTGGGFATRTLYTDDSERIFSAMRPVILTSIEEVATRGDLLDRAIIEELESIPESERRSEREIFACFHAAAGRIQAGLFDAVAGALREEGGVTLSGAPRMADFAARGVAIERALAWPEKSFLSAYKDNRRDVNALPIEESAVGPELMAFAKAEGCESWTWARLLGRLNERADDDVRKPKGWPRTARGLSGEVRRLAPNFRRAGIDIDYGKTGGKRWVTVQLGGDQDDRPNGPDRPSQDENDQNSGSYVDTEVDGSRPTNRPQDGCDAAVSPAATARDQRKRDGRDHRDGGAEASEERRRVSL
jgi:hypothetical protein